MLKDSETVLFPTRRSHRTYTRQFKAELVAACQQPGCSIAALAGHHAMNVNVLHRWLKEHEHDGRHRLIEPDPLGVAVTTSPVPAFIPLKLPTTRQECAVCDIKVELRKGAVTMSLIWPASAAADLAQWCKAVLG